MHSGKQTEKLKEDWWLLVTKNKSCCDRNCVRPRRDCKRVQRGGMGCKGCTEGMPGYKGTVTLTAPYRHTLPTITFSSGLKVADFGGYTATTPPDSPCTPNIT